MSLVLRANHHRGCEYIRFARRDCVVLCCVVHNIQVQSNAQYALRVCVWNLSCDPMVPAHSAHSASWQLCKWTFPCVGAFCGLVILWHVIHLDGSLSPYIYTTRARTYSIFTTFPIFWLLFIIVNNTFLEQKNAYNLPSVQIHIKIEITIFFK